MPCNPFIYTRSDTDILHRKYSVILRPTKTTTQSPGERSGRMYCCAGNRINCSLHQTPGSWVPVVPLLEFPHPVWAVEKLYFTTSSLLWQCRKQHTESQLYTSGWHFRAILHLMSVHSSQDVFPHFQNKDRKKIPPFFVNVNFNILLKTVLGPVTASA